MCLKPSENLSGALTMMKNGKDQGSSRGYLRSATSCLRKVPAVLAGLRRSPKCPGTKVPQRRRVRWDLDRRHWQGQVDRER